MLNSGWNIERLFRITVQCMGNICNSSSTARPTSTTPPKPSKFLPIAHLLRKLQINDLLATDYAKSKKGDQLILYISPAVKFTKSQVQMFRNQRIKFSKVGEDRVIILTTNLRDVSNITNLRLRSTLEILNYLSKGVLISHEDIEKHLAVAPRNPDGSLYDFQKLLYGIMKVRQTSTKTLPPPSIYVKFRNRYFYIPNTDQQSRKTLILIDMLTDLIQAGQPVARPIYTISQN